jgi:hypothetical protein
MSLVGSIATLALIGNSLMENEEDFSNISHYQGQYDFSQARLSKTRFILPKTREAYTSAVRRRSVILHEGVKRLEWLIKSTGKSRLIETFSSTVSFTFDLSVCQ